MSRLFGRITRRGERRRADRLTVGLAGLAIATAGSVLAGEMARLARRRVRRREPPAGVLETAEQALETAGRATQDTVAVAREGYEATPRHETVLFNLLTGFVFAFALIRLSTAGIRGGWWPFGNVRLGGRHIHHFVPGILIAFGAGAVALLSDDSRLEQVLAVPFGAGIGLTFDEAALLLDLRDVYWTREGVLSVQVSCGLAATLGGTISGPAHAPARGGAGRGGWSDPRGLSAGPSVPDSGSSDGDRRVFAGRLEDSLQEARETSLEVVAPKARQPHGGLLTLPNHPRLAQDLEVVSHGRLGQIVFEAPAASLAARVGELASDAEPNRVAERVEHAFEVNFVALRVRDHAQIVRHMPYFGTMFDELRTYEEERHDQHEHPQGSRAPER